MTSLKQAGFTAIELLVTLAVAAAFLVAGYQLYFAIIKDSGQTRAQASASNTAYNYLQRYTSSATNPCVPSTPLATTPISVTGLGSVTVGVTITCPYSTNLTISKVNVTVLYNSPQQTVQYSTFTNGVGYSAAATATQSGLVGWWTMDGNANDSSSNGNNGVVTGGATLTTGQNGQANGAYSFNGSSQYITVNSTLGLTDANVTLSCWVYNPTATNTGEFIKTGANTATGYGIGIGTSYFYTSPGPNIVMLYENVRWIPTTTALGTGWHFVAMVIDGSGIPYAYRDGSLVAGNYSGASAVPPTTGVAIGGGISTGGGTASDFNGQIDDVRIYNRALSATEIADLYAQGAQ